MNKSKWLNKLGLVWVILVFVVTAGYKTLDGTEGTIGECVCTMEGRLAAGAVTFRCPTENCSSGKACLALGTNVPGVGNVQQCFCLTAPSTVDANCLCKSGFRVVNNIEIPWCDVFQMCGSNPNDIPQGVEFVCDPTLPTQDAYIQTCNCRAVE